MDESERLLRRTDLLNKSSYPPTPVPTEILVQESNNRKVQKLALEDCDREVADNVEEDIQVEEIGLEFQDAQA